jgi:cytochrome c oxidase assembly protein subunit 15
LATGFAHPDETPTTPRWLHAWAVFTACATVGLLFAGSLVTTKRVGMADPVWPTAPWFLLVFNWQEPRPGFIIEHAHRAAGYAVGCCAIVLAVGLWWREPRRWVRWLGYAALAGVIIQGLLGGFRVLLDRYLGTDLAFTHGCFAQLVFALMVSVACFTSRGWTVGRLSNDDPAAVRRLRRAAVLTVVLVYLQIIFGAVLRHTYSRLGPRGHFLIAFAVVAAVVWLVKEVWERHAHDRALTVPATLLAALVTAQVMMGVEAWLIRFFAADLSRQILVRTVHVLLGSLILASAAVVTLQAHRRARLASGAALARRETVEPVGCLEEVA